MHTTIVIAHIFNEFKNYLNQYIVLCFYKTDQKQLHGISYTSYVILYLFYLHYNVKFFSVFMIDTFEQFAYTTDFFFQRPELERTFQTSNQIIKTFTTIYK